jgi:hypothetical protein
MSADTNNVSGIWGVPRQRETQIVVKKNCTVRLPNFPALYAAASLDTTSLSASVASLDATLSSSTPPSASMSCRRQPHRTVAIVVPDPSPTAMGHIIAITVPKVGATLSIQSIVGFQWLMVPAFWKMQGGSFFSG